ncbi:general secretion pathway protein C [Legionella beliardensis]|uniref:General secretion pathway protein C n=1 Tax=Legionella beliardensis TaxID=91822 RepID=A0A378I0K6_9GAMM|nr:type II secretion system protein N [Legionella beliardensis]STX28718.1 general secretion pathway protein C [Legionella beliardensis]
MFLSLYESQKLIAIIIFLVMASLFAYQLIDFLQQDLTKIVQPKPAVINSKQVKITTQSILFTKPLFGDYIPVINEADIKESTLDVEIVGIVFSPDIAESQVLIKDTAGEERTYFIGDTLPGGAVIKRISENGIVVLYNGSLESLSLPKAELLFDKPAKPLISEE